MKITTFQKHQLNKLPCGSGSGHKRTDLLLGVEVEDHTCLTAHSWIINFSSLAHANTVEQKHVCLFLKAHTNIQVLLQIHQLIEKINYSLTDFNLVMITYKGSKGVFTKPTKGAY